jgi:hypothetical protein
VTTIPVLRRDREERMMSKDFAVFDGDSHVVMFGEIASARAHLDLNRWPWVRPGHDAVLAFAPEH